MDGSTPLRARWRRLGFGLATLMGRPRGFFAPYRYAAGVARPEGYPELERVFQAAEPAMAAVLDEIDRAGDRLAGFAGPAPEPRWDQTWFPRLDGAAAYAMVQMARPRRIFEVGSGHSTRMLARAAADLAADLGEGPGPQIRCIDPAPRAALNGLAVTWERALLGPQHLPGFQALEPGDIAFFDGSHLLWEGTDCDLVLNRILPALAPGVLVHIHDVTLPDPYPQSWGWRGYTEQLGLAGWLMGGCRLRFASWYAVSRMGAAARPGLAALALPEGALETSLWLERI